MHFLERIIHGNFQFFPNMVKHSKLNKGIHSLLNFISKMLFGRHAVLQRFYTASCEVIHRACHFTAFFKNYRHNLIGRVTIGNRCV